MSFLIRIEVYDLEIVFSNLAISARSRGRASVFLTLVPLLIQISMLFRLFLNFFVEGFTAFSGYGVRQLQYYRKIFNGVVLGVLGRRGLELGQSKINRSFVI